MNKKDKKKYQKPKINVKKVKLNFFFRSTRFSDSKGFLAPTLLAQGTGACSDGYFCLLDATGGGV